MKRFALTALLVLSAVSLVRAWSDSGHKIIASIAFRQLTPEQQAKIAAILKQHPRYDQDFKSKMPAELTNEAEQNEWLFQQAAVWPDIARGFQGDAKKYHHATWHYINLPSFLVPEDSGMATNVNTSLDPPAEQQEEMNAIQVIRMARKKLSDKSVPDSEKAIWICWLFHVVGDIHQPLHSSALFAKTLFPTGDRGGNSIRTDQRGNLHSLWDGFPGGRTDFRTPRNKAIEFVNDEAKASIGKVAATKLDEKTWLDESHQLCETVAYDDEVRGHLRGHLTESSAPPIQLTERYLKAGGAVAERQVIEAGYRLGAVAKQVASAEDTSASATAQHRDYHFDKTISREVLENYLSRSISMEGMFNGRGDLDDHIRMIKTIGAKYIGRSLCLWNGEESFLHNIERAKQQVPKALAAVPDLILEACVFETVSPGVEQIPIPDWVFTALGQPVEHRNFVYANMIYAAPEQRRAMGRNAQVPDEGRPETQLWFYYQAASYIDCGFEGIHFGQVEIMNKNDRDNARWEFLFNLVRDYAAKHARRHMVLLNGHVPSGGLMRNGQPLLDFNAFPLRIMELPDKPQEAILKVGFSDGIYGRSKGGRTVNGWTCEHLPYLVELDNYGVSRHPGQPNEKGNFIWVWGYDEITWFSHQPKEYRAHWLQYAWDWVRQTDSNGFLQMPGSRTASSPETHWYFANNPSPAVPTGLGDEDAIRAVWASGTPH